MSQPKKPEKPDPIEDVREGLGLLFRAARNAVKELPTDKLEETLKTGVREVAHAVESVAGAIEREVFGTKKGEGEPTAAKSEGQHSSGEAGASPNAADPDADKVRVAADGVTTSADAADAKRGDEPAAPPPDAPPKS